MNYSKKCFSIDIPDIFKNLSLNSLEHSLYEPFQDWNWHGTISLKTNFFRASLEQSIKAVTGTKSTTDTIKPVYTEEIPMLKLQKKHLHIFQFAQRL